MGRFGSLFQNAADLPNCLVIFLKTIQRLKTKRYSNLVVENRATEVGLQIPVETVQVLEVEDLFRDHVFGEPTDTSGGRGRENLQKNCPRSFFCKSGLKDEPGQMRTTVIAAEQAIEGGENGHNFEVVVVGDVRETCDGCRDRRSGGILQVCCAIVQRLAMKIFDGRRKDEPD